MNNPKVRIIDDVAANDQFGLSTRFKACLLSKTPWVFIQDDDHFMKVTCLMSFSQWFSSVLIPAALIAQEPGLLRMMAAKSRFPRRIVAAFGRDWKGLEPQWVSGAVERESLVGAGRRACDALSVLHASLICDALHVLHTS